MSACRDARPPAATRTIALGPGVDTTDPDVRAIVALVRAYYAHPDSATRPRHLWSTRDSIDARHGDLAADFVYAERVVYGIRILGVLAVERGDSLYEVALLHAMPAVDGTLSPFALHRLYAHPSKATRFGWALANALPRRTAGWETYRTGRMTFHYAPSMTPSPERADRTARWVDSIAAVFDVTPPPTLDYYVTARPPEYFAALGLDFAVLPSGRGSASGGNAMVRRGMVMAGDRAQAEEYRHELAHMLFVERFGGGAILGEGIPTWLGGSQGRDRWQLFELLRAYQQEFPTVTLASLVAGEVERGWTSRETSALYASGALFVEALHRRGGIEALRALPRFPDDAPALLARMRTTLALDDSRDALERWWRETASTTFPAVERSKP